MYILYVDESGNTGVKDDKTQHTECLCGALISDTKYRSCREKIEKLLKSKELPDDFEIKGYNLFHGEDYWKGKNPEERVDFCKDLSKKLGESGLNFYVKIIKKTGKTDPYIRCLEAIINRTAKKVSKRGVTNRQLLLIFDERKDISSTILSSCMKQRDKLIEKYKKSLIFIDAGFESNSQNCIFLQLADFVAYFYRRQKALIRDNTLFYKADKVITVKTIDEIISNLNNKIIKVE